MFLVDILSWWYSGGFTDRAHMMKSRLDGLADFFSIGLLFTTLFAPYRQISVGSIGVSLSEQMHAFFDKLLSRIIGSIVRTFMIIAGLIVMFFQVIFGMTVLLFWLVIPMLPIVGLIMMSIGWVPTWMN